MTAVLDAIRAFVEHLAAVRWQPLAIAVGLHLVKLAVASRAWRNVVAAAYPDARVPWRSAFAAFVAGTGVNAVVPARGGDAVKLYIAKRRVEGSTYTTLASTIVLLTLFDMVVSGSLLVWAISQGVLPGLDILPSLPSFDFRWFFEHPKLGGALGGAFLLLVLIGGVWAARRVAEFRRRVAQGFSAFRDKRYWLLHVVPWQLVDWTLRLLVVFFFLRALKIPATVHNALLVQVSQSLATVFPFSPAGIGTEQAFLLYIFRGVAARSALLSFSVGMRVTLIVANATLGFTAILLTLRTLRWRRRIESEAPAAREA
jgi:glycosyltransferase 2 family protein